MCVPIYPIFEPLSLKHREEIEPFFNNLNTGISEFTFPSLFVHRTKYKYKISCSGPGEYIFAADLQGVKYFFTPFKIPNPSVIQNLFQDFDFWDLLSERQIIEFVETLGEEKAVISNSMSFDTTFADSCQLMYGNFNENIPLNLPGLKLKISENRKNWDYIYYREKLAALSGKSLHKKKNLVNQFNKLYLPDFKPLCPGDNSISDALLVLEQWQKAREMFEDKSFYDYYPTKEALENFAALGFSGAVVYIGDKPAGFTLGEKIPGMSHYAVHFEKGLAEYKGIYQYLNQAYACILPEDIEYINREQDLDDEGLRQAKLSYKPCGMIKKFAVFKA